MSVIAKEVEIEPGATTEVWHSLAVADYVAIVALTPSERVPIVRQYRAAIEAFTWELPAGLVDPGESAEETCRRELREEAGVVAQSITPLGEFFPDTGRLANRLHAFLVRCSDPDPDFEPEPRVEVAFVEIEQLWEMIREGDFRHSLHLGALLSAQLRGLRLHV